MLFCRSHFLGADHVDVFNPTHGFGGIFGPSLCFLQIGFGEQLEALKPDGIKRLVVELFGGLDRILQSGIFRRGSHGFHPLAQSFRTQMLRLGAIVQRVHTNVATGTFFSRCRWNRTKNQ